ncbi:MAG TPA: hypothetical protein DEH78_01390 [Solibacterales bacterium]|nr:hypothetical protein [Bryobacterales bacterium]
MSVHAVCVALALALPAASQTVGGPLTGYVFDLGTRSIRAVQGLPGGARLAAPVLSGLDWASVSPHGDRALVSIEGRLSLIRDLKAPSLEPLPGEAQGFERAAWAPGGEAAVLSRAASGQLRLLRVQPEPAVEALDLSSFGTVASVSVTGQLDLLVSVANENGGTLVWTAPGRDPIAIASLGSPALLSGITRHGSVFAIDAACRLFEIQNAGSGARLLPLTTACEGGTPTSIAATPDGSSVALVWGSTLRFFEPATGALSEPSALALAPASLDSVSTGGVWWLSGPRPPGAPAWLLDARGPSPSVLFVPEAPAETPAAPEVQ